ncbi:kinase-like protein [Suhomyces tanzawaensis NRRL Y-17324]|uniref:Kinase-like protein n=1 Tax=Suhomyces tanzawaensis NRRL Y-17324 TaxID=984487 RepID=A0A1E4SD88_9ASCO|nr:kinase-like protein [Suhomyces tanzawaensis NRRL Y-17324]ODV77479.1 kinase-like protein [Suhomyces tanzawaensis NRRL Y-17324]
MYLKYSNTIYEERGAAFRVNSRYKIVSLLGKGSYGTVCSAIDTNSTPLKVAIKKINSIFTREVLLKRAVRELKLMRHFRGHGNIASLLDADIIHMKPYDGLYCIQEFVDCDLARVIYSSIQFSEFHIQSFVYQILCGLKYIHSADVIHRDLKPGNILVNAQGTLKICDFGLARGISTKYVITNSSPITNYVATRWYRAPELMLSKHKYDKSVDVWAVGCIMAELYGRRPLFAGKDQLHQLHEIMKILGSPPVDVICRLKWRCTIPPSPQYISVKWKQLYPFASNDALSLIFALLKWDPAERLDVNVTLRHNFFEDVRDPYGEPECDRIFDFSFENNCHTIPELTTLLEQEVLEFKKDRLG